MYLIAHMEASQKIYDEICNLSLWTTMHQVVTFIKGYASTTYLNHHQSPLTEQVKDRVVLKTMSELDMKIREYKQA